MESSCEGFGVIEEFGRKLNMPFETGRDIIILKTKEGERFWLEVINTSPFVIMHTNLAENAREYDALHKLIYLLSLNTQVETMKGAWIGFHEETNSIKLCITVASERLSVDTLELMFTTLQKQSERLKERL